MLFIIMPLYSLFAFEVLFPANDLMVGVSAMEESTTKL